ncbi:MAG TPA: tetraacyldisaccharide 4'-kinase, partial [Dyella sp.]|nr:tetraacyldisaccharide 4'-kinase [Dyella sp.]
GGTGKTPLTLALVDALVARGWRPGVVSRGYGGTQREPALLGDDPDPAQFGDEPCLIRASGVPVAVGRDRPAAAALLLDAGCNVVIADDGLQHYALARDVEICVIDGDRRFGNGRLLPAGPLREPLSRLRRVDFRVCNGAAGEGEYAMHLEGGAAVSLTDGSTRPLASFVGSPVHAVAAIGHPDRFFDSLRAQGLDIVGHAFADHHAFVPDDLAIAGDGPLLMTDKDAIKCRRFARPGWWRVPVCAVLDGGFIDALCQRLDTATAGRTRPIR